ncbi:hypothetical protein HID58_069209 [Brassica napus]|uniref:Uncharacterized protein n=1 Tax=Brassica napus TaxID=3708 RepID=A0ABQ7XEV4_BRANA|nr:hypothetical protein HID58_069209 [Brassica napus]
MEGSSYRKSSISWRGGRFLGLVPGFLLAGTWSVPLSGTRGPGSCLEAGGNDTGASLRQDSGPSVSLSWIPLKPELILNPGKDREPKSSICIGILWAGEVTLLPDPGEGSEYDLMAPLPLAYTYAYPSPVGPTSTVVEDDLVEWRRKYSLPPLLTSVYPHRRSMLPAIKLVRFLRDFSLSTEPSILETSRGYSEPGRPRALILWDQRGFVFLSFGPLNGGEGRFHLRPRSGLPIVEELRKSDRKGSAFNKKWQERYVFMRLPRHSYRWNFVAGTHPAFPEGESTVLRARQLPLDRRQVNFLLSNSVLHRSSLWGNMSEGTVNDPFAAYQEAAKVISAKKESARRGSASGTTSGDEVVITGSRQLVTVKMEPPSLAQTKKPQSGGIATRSSQQSVEATCSVGILATALSNLNLQVFPQDGTVLPPGEPSEVVHTLQWGLLRTISQLFHLGERLSNESPVASREELEDLKRQASEERAQRLAREMEICDLKDKVKDLERTAEVSSADALATSKRNSELEEAMGTLKLEMVMAVNGARVIGRWDLIREWLKGQSNQWDLVKALEQFKAVTLEEAKIRMLRSPHSKMSPPFLFFLGGLGDLPPELRWVEKALWGSSCKIQAAWALGAGIPWNPRNRDRDLSCAPAYVDFLAIGDSRPVFPGDEGSQHGHEMCSRIHPPERPDMKNSGLARDLCPPLAGYPLPQIRPDRILRGPCLLSRYRFGKP